MNLSQKDKSFILLITSVLIVLWALYSLFSFLFFNSTFRASATSKIIVTSSEENKKTQWFNVLRPLEAADLKDRLILLDFWTYACVNCMQILPEIQKLEQEYGSRLTVIGVHSGKFENEKDAAAIRKAILRYDITNPVINDADYRIWNGFGVTAWPTMILINPNGKIVKTYVGEGEVAKLKADVKKLVSKFKYEINRDPLPVMLEKNSVITTVLNSPTKIEYASDLNYKTHQTPALFIANSGKHNIVISTLSGDIIAKVGSAEGFADGNLSGAAFNYPQGLLYAGNKLYVADTGNHTLREIDFKTNQVKTLIGSGQKGEALTGQADAKTFNLASPTDIAFFPAEGKNHNKIVIANSGTHQILTYDLQKETISILAGNGVEGIVDGKYPNNSLAQTSDLAVYGKKLYFIDAETSSLRMLEENGHVTTLIGQDLFKFGHKNGSKNEALMQHPLGLSVDDTGVYILDSFNHSLRKYDFASKQLRDLIKPSKRGDNLGSAASTEFDEPQGIVAVLDRFYIADTNNNRVVIVNRGSFKSQLLDVMPPLKLEKAGFLEYLPNLQKSETVAVKSDAEILLKIDLKKGWKINESGPSFINLLELVKDDQANLVTSFDWNVIKGKELKLPKLNSKKDYVLQGVIYFCEDKVNSLCQIVSYEQEVKAESGEKNEKIDVKIGY